MKILIINDYATWAGGSEIMTLTIRDELRQRGHDARIFASSARWLNTPVLADYQCFGTSSRFSRLLETANLSAAWQLQRVLAEFQPDVVHVRQFLTQISPLILPLLKDIPSLLHVVDYRPLCPKVGKLLPDRTICFYQAGIACYRHHCLPLYAWATYMLQRKLWQKWRNTFNLIIANSEAVKSRLVAEGIKPVEVVWNGVSVRQPRPPLKSPPTVVFAGRLSWEKGTDILVRAFAKVVSVLPQAHLLIAGDGSEHKRITKLIAELALSNSVSLLGFLSHPEIESYFTTGWVQVVPSLFAEPFGLVAAEAMMRGSAVIASNSGGLAEIVKHGETGFLVPPGDVDKLAVALLKILQNQELAEHMGKAGREVALTHFNKATCVERLIELYQTLLENKGIKGDSKNYE